ncbi:MAG: hypothetical protein H7282_02615 [Cytophagaceae bacterium]|nr:hypothetical protein [Cytophagaceae bacterium]
MKQIIFALSFIVILFACKKKDDPAPAPSPDNNVPSTQWYSFKSNSGDTAKALDGYLYLTSTYTAGTTGGTSVASVKKIKGDFELLVKFSSFNPPTISYPLESFGIILAASETHHGTISCVLLKDYMYVNDSSASTTSPKSTHYREGEWYVKRVGADYTSWFRAGSDTLKLNKTNYITSDLSLSFSVGSFDNTSHSTSVHIDDFTLTGGGGDVKSDAFDQNDITSINL